MAFLFIVGPFSDGATAVPTQHPKQILCRSKIQGRSPPTSDKESFKKKFCI